MIHTLLFLFSTCCLCLSSLAAADQWDELEAATLLSTTDSKTARTQLEDILTENPLFYAAHYNLGCLLIETELDNAVRHLRTASASPIPALAARAEHNLARALYDQGRLQDALAAATAALEREPENTDYVQSRNELRRVYFLRRDQAKKEAEERAKQLRLITKACPDATVNRLFTHTLQAAGGTGAPYRFSSDPEKPLPEGLTVSETGELSGTLSEKGSHTLEITVYDENSSAVGSCTLTVLPEPAILTEQLPEAILNNTYTAQLNCEGITTASWSASTLPAGLTINAKTGALSGTPTKEGSYPLTITVSDGTRSAHKDYTLIVSDSFAPDHADFPAATAWTPYTHTITMRGPSGRYSFAGEAGGLHVSETGTLAGSPEDAGTIEFPLEITAPTGDKRGFKLQLPVNKAPVITESEPITLKTGHPIQRPLAHEGGTHPFSWEVQSGLLPEGLRLDTDGVIRGATPDPAAATISVRLSDRWGAQTELEITLQVESSPDDPQQQQEEQEQQAENSEEQNEEQQDSEQGEQEQQEQAQNSDEQQEQGEPSQEENESSPEEQSEQQAAQAAEEAAEKDAEQQSDRLKEAAAASWLDSLPEERDEALRYQLLQGRVPQTEQQGDPW